MMPFVGWYDSATGQTRPFGSEWDWPNAPFGPEMLADIAERIVSDRNHDFDVLTPTTLLSSPRQVLIERFLDCYLDPEYAVSKQIGSIVHERLTGQLVKAGYSEEPLELKAFGETIRCRPDGWREPPETQAGIVELKVATSGSLKFIVEAGRGKDEHECQASMYAHARSQRTGIPVGEQKVELRYYCMPQKEKLFGSWTRMRPGVSYPVEVWPLERIEAFVPGYSTPKRATDYQGPPPTSVGENMKILSRAFAAIRTGADPLEVVGGVECQCPRRFNGQGRAYCSVRGRCAMEDHGTQWW